MFKWATILNLAMALIPVPSSVQVIVWIAGIAIETKMLPREWIYVIPNGENEHILYAPLHKMTVRVTPEAANNISQVISGTPETAIEANVLAFLREYGLLRLPESSPNKKSHKIFLSITNKCNLRCIYCYASAGVDNSTMEFSTAKNALDYQLQQIINSDGKKIAVTFHGGGEALVELNLLMKIVEYINEVADKNELKPILGLVTNATLITKEIAQWLAINFSHLTISLDGVQEVQNVQRPNATNAGSFDKVMSGIQNLIDEKVNISVRATVTEFSVDKMVDFIYFVKDNIFQNGGNVDFEPVSLCGRAKDNSNLVTTNADIFLENYIFARQVGRKIGIDVTCSMDTFGSIKDSFCGASQAELQCFTPDNMLSACTRVTKKSDDGASLFFYGNVKNSHVQIDSSAKEKIKAFGSDFGLECYTCFAKWNCQGGCPISRLNDRENFEQACYVTKAILFQDLKNALETHSANSLTN